MEINDKLDKHTMRPDMLLSGLGLLEESSRDAPAYTDPRNFPFWYYFGQECNKVWSDSKTVVQFGGQLGLIAGSFMKACSKVGTWIVMNDHKEVDTFVIRNIKRVSPNVLCEVRIGNRDFIGQEVGKYVWDLGIITSQYNEEDMKFYMQKIWDHMHEGLLVVDYITSVGHARRVLESFCRVNNREPKFFSTRYGIGIVQK